MVFFMGAGTCALVLFSSPQLPRDDAYYHIQMATLIREQRFPREFPWARETILANHFSDKELLFHLLLAPLVRNRPIVGAKIFTCLLSGAVFAVFAATLKAAGCRFSGWWTMLLLGSGTVFIFRLSLPRPHVFSLLMLLLTLLGLLRKWWYQFFFLGVVYALGYSVPHLMVIVLLLYGLGLRLAREKEDWKALAFALAGLLAGFLVHPNFPSNFYFWYVQTIRAPLHAWGIAGSPLNQGAELISPSGKLFLKEMTLPVFGVAACIIGYLWRGQRPSNRVWPLLCCWGFFLGLTLLSIRFAEYFVPFSILLSAVAFTDLSESVDWEQWFEGHRAARTVILVGILLVPAFFGLQSVLSAQSSMNSDTDLAEAAQWLGSHLEPREVVFHTEWGDFPQLFHYAPKQHYLVALDPVFMYAKDPSKWRLWEDISSGRQADTPHLVRSQFNSRFIVLYLPRREALDRRLRRSPEAKQVYRNSSYVIYQLM